MFRAKYMTSLPRAVARLVLGLGAVALAAPAVWGQTELADPIGGQQSFVDWAVPLLPGEDLGYLTVCFDAENPPSDEFIAEMFAALQDAGRMPPPDSRYFLGSRWSGTQGSPRSLTWSFVPDGLSIPNGIGEGTAPSQLFSRLDSIFATQGGRATWIARFQQCFDRWSELSGVSYTRITHNGNDWDDGASWGATGSSTRGDIRICMKPLDGANGVLAYNFFPSNGDMVLDSGEGWNSTTNQNRFLRNTVMHEHGHGLGIQHVCSNNQVFLMEPFLSTAVDGPRHDDLRAVQRHYGDPGELDDSAALAKFLGTFLDGQSLSNHCDLPPPDTGTAAPSTTNCSIDANSEADWYSFLVNSAATVSVTVTPQGFTYNNNAQAANGSCPTTSSYNSLITANLAVQVISSNGVTILGEASSAASGQSESLNNVVLPSQGLYYIRVYETDSPSQSQLYSFSMSVTYTGGDPCPEDLNGDGTIDFDDLLVLLAAYGANDNGDIDGDGDTDFDDLVALLSAYGSDCP